MKHRVRAYLELLPSINAVRKALKETVSNDMKRLIHNLVTQNAHNVQEIFHIVPQDVLSQSMSHQIQKVSDIIKDSPAKVAKSFLRIHKNNHAMKSEFSVFSHLYDPTEYPLKTRLHPIHKVVMNVLHLFFEDFIDKQIKIDVDYSEIRVKLDYETVQVALYHLIENASKYCLVGSVLHVTFTESAGRQSVMFDMISVEITDVDNERMFDEGYSGRIPKALKLAGGGFGLGIIRGLLALNNAFLLVKRNVNPSLRTNPTIGVYENNQFEIVFGAFPK